MLWIGVTGSIGSGKTAVSLILRDLGFAVLDADTEAHAALSPGSAGLQEVLQAFGRDILTSEGVLDRRKLGQIVFERPERLQQLEAIVHPLVQKSVREKREALARSGVTTAFYDVPLLFEKKMQNQFAKVLVVTADLDKMVERVSARSALSRSDVMQRLQTQLPLSEKVKMADVVVQNNGSLADLKTEVLQALKKLGISPAARKP